MQTVFINPSSKQPPKSHLHGKKKKSNICNVVLLSTIIVFQWVFFVGSQFIWLALWPSTPTTPQTNVATMPMSNTKVNENWEGVAVVVMVFIPQWAHLRYTQMVHNALANIPETWGVQIVYDALWAYSSLFPHHNFLHQSWEEHNRVLRDRDPKGHRQRIHWTPIPEKMVDPQIPMIRHRPKSIVASKWFWQSLKADQVILFNGNGAFCGNHHPLVYEKLKEYDFCGIPVGSGQQHVSHSYRKRNSMLKVIQYYQETRNKSSVDPDTGYTPLAIMKEMNLKGVGHFRWAVPEVSQLFGGTSHLFSSNVTSQAKTSPLMPLVVSGVQSELEQNEREKLLLHCPEAQVMFHSLHHPSCFGASPNRTECQKHVSVD